MTQRKDTSQLKNYTHTIKAPTHGMIYLSARPDGKPLVEIGQQVKAGDTICLMEMMKMFTEIKATEDGIISERHVEHGSFVDPNIPLFTLQVTEPEKVVLSNSSATRIKLDQQKSKLTEKLKYLEEHLAKNPAPGFEDCAQKLQIAVSAALKEEKNVTIALDALNASWGQYWQGISNTYAEDVCLKNIMTSVLTTLSSIAGFIAGSIAGVVTAPFISPLTGIAGLVVGAAAGAYFSNRLADHFFFKQSKATLDAAVNLSGKVREIKDDIESISKVKP